MDETQTAVNLPSVVIEVIDRLRGSHPRSDWLVEAAVRMARQQIGQDPRTPIGWLEIIRELR